MHEPRLPGENTTRAGERGERSAAGSTNSQIPADSRTGLILTNRAGRNAAPWVRREFQVADETEQKKRRCRSQTPRYEE